MPDGLQRRFDQPRAVAIALLATASGALLLTVAMLGAFPPPEKLEVRANEQNASAAQVFIVMRAIVGGAAMALLIACAASLILLVRPNDRVSAFLETAWTRLRAGAQGGQSGSGELAVCMLLAIWAAILGLPLIAYCLVSPWPLAAHEPWVSSADRRWWLIGYNVLWLTPLVLPLLARAVVVRLFATQTRAPQEPPGAMPFALPGSAADLALRLAAAAAVAFVLIGPPWNSHLVYQTIDSHLAESMAGFQGINSGALPYVGSAGFGYGPGLQSISSLYQHLAGGPSVSRFCDSYGFLNWLAATVYCAFVFGLFGVRTGLLFAALLFLISPFVLYQWQAPGNILGLFGWATAARNVGLPTVCLGYCALLLVGPARRWPALALGAFWGATAYLSQENGTLIAVGLLAITAAAVGGEVSDLRRARAILVPMAAGAAAVFGAVVLVYAINGAALQFLANYQLIPGYASQGVTGRYWPDGTPLSERLASAGLVIFAISTGAGALLRLKPLELAVPLSPMRFLILALSIAALLGYMPMIIRPAGLQMISGTIVVPLLLTMLIVATVRSAQSPGRRMAGLAGIGLIVLAAYPLRLGIADVPHMLAARVAAVGHLGSDERAGPGPVERRFHRLLAQSPVCCQEWEPYSGPELLALAKQLNAELGAERVYIDSLPRLWLPGAMTFLAALNVSPAFEELNTRYPSARAIEKRHAEVAARAHEIDAMVTVSLDRPLPKLILSKLGSPTVEERSFLGRAYFIIRGKAAP